MNLILIFFVNVILILAEDKNSPALGESIGKKIVETALSTILGTEGGVSISQLQAIRDLVKVESTSTLKDRWESKGFSQLDLGLATKNAEGVSSNFLLKRLEINTLFPELSSKLPLHERAVLQSALESCKEIVIDQARTYQEQKFSLKFDSGNGNFGLIFVEIARNQESSDRWDFKSAISSGSFVAAPDFLIIQRSKSNFFGSKSWFEMVPLQPQMTPQKIDELFGIVFPRFAEWLLRVSPNKALPKQEL